MEELVALVAVYTKKGKFVQIKTNNKSELIIGYNLSCFLYNKFYNEYYKKAYLYEDGTFQFSKTL